MKKESKQGMIAEEGGLDAFLKILESLQDRTILQLASVAIANLANYGNIFTSENSCPRCTSP